MDLQQNKRNLSLAGLLWLMSAWSFLLFAQDDFVKLPFHSSQRLSYKYVAPNEEFPQRARSAFELAPQGAYLSVGTERGFIGAANSPNVTHLILVDRSAEVCTYNKINVILLKMARDRKHYLELRLHPTKDAWFTAAAQAGVSMRDRIFIAKNFSAWESYVAHSPRFEHFHSKPGILPMSRYRGVNYLYDDHLFNRIHNMARNNRIAVGSLHLEDTVGYGKLIMQLSNKKIQLSVVDISNAWWKSYAKRIKLIATMNRLNHYALSDTILLTTTFSTLTRVLQTLWDRTNSPWIYRAFTFEEIRRYPEMASFLDALKLSSLSINPSVKINQKLSSKLTLKCVSDNLWNSM